MLVLHLFSLKHVIVERYCESGFHVIWGFSVQLAIKSVAPFNSFVPESVSIIVYLSTSFDYVSLIYRGYEKVIILERL